MVTNVDYEYAKAIKQYASAKTLEEKLEALESMQSAAPNHKGAENLRADLASKIAKIKRKIEKAGDVKGKGKSLRFSPEGPATVVLLGLPNSGKSTLLSKITNAKPEINNYAFTTKTPEIGVMGYNGTNIQVVELPAIIRGSHKGKARGKEILSLARNGDLLVCVLLGDEQKAKKSLDTLLKELRESNIIVNKKLPSIFVNKTSSQGVEIFGETNVDDIEKLQKELNKRYSHIVLRVDSKAKVEDILEAIDSKSVCKKVVGVWLNGNENFKYKNVSVYPFLSTVQTKRVIYNNLDLITVYTRKPGEKDDDNVPIALKSGATVKDLCNSLHNEFLKKFRFARIWGSGKYPGQQVSLGYELKSKDVVELYIKK